MSDTFLQRMMLSRIKHTPKGEWPVLPPSEIEALEHSLDRAELLKRWHEAKLKEILAAADPTPSGQRFDASVGRHWYYVGSAERAKRIMRDYHRTPETGLVLLVRNLVNAGLLDAEAARQIDLTPPPDERKEKEWQLSVKRRQAIDEVQAAIRKLVAEHDATKEKPQRGHAWREALSIWNSRFGLRGGQPETLLIEWLIGLAGADLVSRGFERKARGYVGRFFKEAERLKEELEKNGNR